MALRTTSAPVSISASLGPSLTSQATASRLLAATLQPVYRPLRRRLAEIGHRYPFHPRIFGECAHGDAPHRATTTQNNSMHAAALSFVASTYKKMVKRIRHQLMLFPASPSMTFLALPRRIGKGERGQEARSFTGRRCRSRHARLSGWRAASHFWSLCGRSCGFCYARCCGHCWRLGQRESRRETGSRRR